MSVDDAWVTERFAGRKIDKVAPNPGAAGERSTEARRHIASARAGDRRGPCQLGPSTPDYGAAAAQASITF